MAHLVFDVHSDARGHHQPPNTGKPACRRTRLGEGGCEKRGMTGDVYIMVNIFVIFSHGAVKYSTPQAVMKTNGGRKCPYTASTPPRTLD